MRGLISVLTPLATLMLVCGVAALADAAAIEAELSIAAMQGDGERVKALLAQGVDANDRQGDGTSALHWAAYREDLELARHLIVVGAEVEAKTRLADMTPLLMASKNGDAAMIELLIEAGADPAFATTNGTTPLMMAAASGGAEAVEVLLDHEADPDLADVHQGQTALMFAAAPGRVDVVRVLVARAADIHATSLVPKPRKVEGAGGPKWRKGDIALGGMAALHFAAREGHRDVAEALLEGGADVNQLTASNNTTALTIAVINAHFDLAMYLLERGADPKPAVSSDGLTALYAAIDAQWANRVWYPVPKTDEQLTGYLDLVQALLERGADPDARLTAELWQRQMHGDWVKPAGATPFWRAAQANDVAAMKLLVAAGANPTIGTFKGCSPVQVAAGYGLEPQTSTFIPDARLDAVRYLVEEVGADVSATDLDGYTPLHGAGLTADNTLIQYLVAMGADVKARSHMILGGAEDPDQDVAPGTGDTVADMANGPKPHNLVYPQSVALLVDMGSENSENCRASTCESPAKKDSRKSKK